MIHGTRVDLEITTFQWFVVAREEDSPLRRTRNSLSATEDIPISTGDSISREIDELELALLRGGIDERTAERERCARCDRTPLIGERVYRYERGEIVCELCRSRQPGPHISAELVHGPAFGHTIRIVDQRAA